MHVSVDYTIIHTILRYKKYFSNLTLTKSNVNNISSPIDIIQDFGRTTIILPYGIKFYINDALSSTKSNQNLLSFKYIY